MRDMHIRADEEEIRIVTLTRHHDGVVHHTGVIDIGQIDCISTKRGRAFSTFGVDNMALERRAEFPVEILGIGGLMVIEKYRREYQLVALLFFLSSLLFPSHCGRMITPAIK